MRFIRFDDERGELRFGYDPDARFTRATLLDGSPLTGGIATGESVGIGRLLCPI